MSGLYIHIPFCHSKCAYCDFFSTPNNSFAAEYVEALIKEYNARRSEIPDETFRTIYLGGGTPSSLSQHLLQRILSRLPVAQAEEVTIEVNPEDVTDRFADFVSDMGVNRVSMGVQSLDDRELAFIGRRHTGADAIKAFKTLRNHGFDNISLDLIYGLPGQSLESWIRSVTVILELQPEHLSAYSLMLEPGTRLWAMAQSGRFSETPDEVIEQMYASLCNATRDAGLTHYEISNFARRDRESIHNSAYWDFSPYLGLGTGAHSFDGSNRRVNSPRIKDYIASPENFAEIEPETTDEQINDYIMVRLRTSRGLQIEEFKRLFGQHAYVKLQSNISAQPYGNIILSNGHYSIPEEKFLISDSIISEIFI